MKIIFNKEQAQKKYNENFKPMENQMVFFTILCAVTTILSVLTIIFLNHESAFNISLVIAAIAVFFGVFGWIKLHFYIEKLDTATAYYSLTNDSKVLDTSLSLIGFNSKNRKAIVEITLTLETKKGKTKKENLYFEGTGEIKDIADFEVDLDNELVYFPRNLEGSSLCQM